MRVLIRSTWSENIQELTDVCSANHRAYCAKHGYDYKAYYFDYQNYNDCVLDELRDLLEELKA